MLVNSGASQADSVCYSVSGSRQLVMVICYVFLLACGVQSQKAIKTSVPVQNTKKLSSSRQGRVFFNQLFSLTNLIAGGASFFDNAVAPEDDDDDIFDNEYKARNCSCECGVSNQENRIVGGRPTGINRYPWVARILYDGHYHCGASLLTEEFVLTAAHCIRSGQCRASRHERHSSRMGPTLRGWASTICGTRSRGTHTVSIPMPCDAIQGVQDYSVYAVCRQWQQRQLSRRLRRAAVNSQGR
ncbi:unnamed protein product [Acanthoscelides obtectus]|uniref:Peptidase S1 domain-containing protein n=1 Tax=Acanthoscelides obtectus TaxID=200917 RepID=A0A9P0P9Y0_ACAOB|nr:unnamed protein product [Acanthoscelides obtectus]CAK1633117.1 Brain-specific serine protease 4 [Acanthoscelides obtectus]